MEGQSHTGVEPTSPKAVLRLTFSYQGDEVALDSHRLVEMTVPPSHPVEEYRGGPGDWFEVLDAGGGVLYGQRLYRPIKTHHEVFAPDGSASWIAQDTVEGAFEVVAPLPPGATTVVVMSSPSADPSQPAREIARVQVREVLR
jgi:hypothetical protein